MTTERMAVGVVVEHRRIDHPWQSHRWQVTDVLPGVPMAEPWTVLARTEDVTRYLAGVAMLELFPGESENYRYNLDSAEPAIYVVLRTSGEAPGMRLLGATVDPGEAHAHADTGDDLVEALPLPAPIRDWLAAFVEAHPVRRTHGKRRRDRADPEALAFGRRPDRNDGDGDDDE
jgi:hypothetical protein